MHVVTRPYHSGTFYFWYATLCASCSLPGSMPAPLHRRLQAVPGHCHLTMISRGRLVLKLMYMEEWTLCRSGSTPSSSLSVWSVYAHTPPTHRPCVKGIMKPTWRSFMSAQWHGWHACSDVNIAGRYVSNNAWHRAQHTEHGACGGRIALPGIICGAWHKNAYDIHILLPYLLKNRDLMPFSQHLPCCHQASSTSTDDGL